MQALLCRNAVRKLHDLLLHHALHRSRNQDGVTVFLQERRALSGIAGPGW